MANTKISALTALTGADLANDDAFAVVDTSATATKKITVAEMKLGIMPAPGPIGGTTPSTGAFTTLSATGNIITTGVDAAAQIGVKGTTKGLRIGTNVTGARVEGVDTTLMTTFQPLTLNGTTISIESNSADVGVFSSTGLAVTGTVKATTGMAVGGATPGTGGLAFPATAVAVADVNTLDDYEEGTFTPVIAFGGASVGVTYSEQLGKYTKVGNKVSITIAITLANKGSSAGALSITGLPFTNATVNTAAGVKMSNTTFTGQYSSYVGASGTIIHLQHTTEAGTLANLADTNCTNISVFNFATSYLI